MLGLCVALLLLRSFPCFVWCVEGLFKYSSISFITYLYSGVRFSLWLCVCVPPLVSMCARVRVCLCARVSIFLEAPLTVKITTQEADKHFRSGGPLKISYFSAHLLQRWRHEAKTENNR